jgi:hypothetical protein
MDLPLTKKLHSQFLKVKHRLLNMTSDNIPVYLKSILKDLEMLADSIPALDDLQEQKEQGLEDASELGCDIDEHTGKLPEQES